jgi:hypothetical protein
MYERNFDGSVWLCHAESPLGPTRAVKDGINYRFGVPIAVRY